MLTSSSRFRAVLGGVFTLALVTAPLSLALDAGAAAPHAVTPHADKPFLAAGSRARSRPPR